MILSLKRKRILMGMTIAGANTTAQLYQSKYPDAAVFDHLEKELLHTTETSGWPGYAGGASAPNITYHPRLREIRQHFFNNRSARALRDPTGTPVRENRDFVFQIEIVAYSDYAVAQSVGGLWIGDLKDYHYEDLAKIAHQLHDELGLPLQQSLHWMEGRKTAFSDEVRLSSSQYDAYRGICGHCHASGNTHWDPGGFYISKYMAAIQGADVSGFDKADLAVMANTDNVFKAPASYSGVKDGTNKFWSLNSHLSYLSDDVRYKIKPAVAALDKKLNVILATIQGSGSQAIIDLINEKSADDAARDNAMLETFQQWADGKLDAEAVLRKMGELLINGLPVIPGDPGTVG
jgi:hypothetical protein